MSSQMLDGKCRYLFHTWSIIISGSNLLGALDLYMETPDGKEVYNKAVCESGTTLLEYREAIYNRQELFEVEKLIS